jgi:triacylglycerol lipase
MKHHIYLIPGFFGFANVGRLRYFLHVRQFLIERCAALGLDVEVEVVKTLPTSSLPTRAARVVETIAPNGRGPVHLIGHSSGGLDARLVVTPNVTLPSDIDVERVAQRVRTVVTVSTPHYGSPLASFLAGLRGQKLLELLSVSTTYVLRFGSLPLNVLLQLATIFGGAATVGANPTLLEELFQRLLADFSVGRRAAVERLLDQVAKDQSLLVQLTPEGLDVFNAAAGNRPTVRYGCVVTRARQPGVLSTLATGLDVAAQASHTLYHALYHFAAQMPRARVPALDAPAAQALRHAYRGLPPSTANDGIVPTRAQVWGEIIQAVQADHLDGIGHFADPAHHPPHFDWITTRSGFTREKFEALWTAVMSFMLPNGDARRGGV